jgi:putative tricarboxylic transport membrane protein
VIGLILGPLAEVQLRRALTISLGDASVLFSSPISIVLYTLRIVALVAPFFLGTLRKMRSDED